VLWHSQVNSRMTQSVSAARMRRTSLRISPARTLFFFSSYDEGSWIKVKTMFPGPNLGRPPPVNISARRTQRHIQHVSSQLQSSSLRNMGTLIASLMLTGCPSRFPPFQFSKVTYHQCRCNCCRVALPRASITRSPVPTPSILCRLCLPDHSKAEKITWVGALV